MCIIELEISDELAGRLSPYRAKLPEILEIGLQVHVEREQYPQRALSKELPLILADSEKVRWPKPYAENRAYVRHTPVSSVGKPTSEVVIEQRGNL